MVFWPKANVPKLMVVSSSENELSVFRSYIVVLYVPAPPPSQGVTLTVQFVPAKRDPASVGSAYHVTLILQL